MQHPVFGGCVRFGDLIDLDLTACEPIGLIYADLIGSISELQKMLIQFARATYTDGAVVAATISCRDASAFTNEFAENATICSGDRF